MQDYVVHALTVFMGFFAIMNPITNTTIFLALTEDDTADVRRAVARRALIVAFLIIVVFTLAGRMIFEMFGIGLPAFQITGGLLVLLIGFHMVQGEPSSVQHPGHARPASVPEGELDKAISPLAVPLLAGPGTIATAINFASRGGIDLAVTTLAAFFVLCVMTYFFFVYGEHLVRYLGHQGMSVITRLMGLILAVIGTQMIIGGVTGAIRIAAT
jgi:multiple antibiotic resistance protein